MRFPRLLLVLVPIALFVEPGRTQKVDFSAVDLFWPIYDQLKMDGIPSAEQWDQLFATPGLAALEEREHRRQTLMRAYRLAYSPGQRDSLNLVREGGGFIGYILPHLSRIPALRERLLAFQEKLAKADLLGAARMRARELLPPGITQKHAAPPISFVFFAPDGRGYPQIIIADLLNILESRSQTGFFAHELHHYYRNFTSVLHDDFSDDDYYLMYVLINLEEEGIADQLDKADLSGLSEEDLRRQIPNADRRGFYERYRRHYTEANNWLSRIDSVFTQIAGSPTLSGPAGKQLHGELPIGGRPIGSFMAASIIREFGKTRLAEVVGNPFDFWRLYNEAARVSEGKGFVLSPQAMMIVDRLEARYSQRRGQ